MFIALLAAWLPASIPNGSIDLLVGPESPDLSPVQTAEAAPMTLVQTFAAGSDTLTVSEVAPQEADLSGPAVSSMSVDSPVESEADTFTPPLD